MASKALLVVDDEPRNVELIRMVLEETGLPVDFVGARDGLEALRLARDLAPALILMDLKMPALDGWEATCRLNFPQYRSRCLAAGADFFFDKSTELHQVVGALGQLARGAANQR